MVASCAYLQQRMKERFGGYEKLDLDEEIHVNSNNVIMRYVEISRIIEITKKFQDEQKAVDDYVKWYYVTFRYILLFIFMFICFMSTCLFG